MVDRKLFLEKVEEIRREQPKYRKGGDGSDKTCDCIGLIMGALRRAGETWKGTHGSNYAARNQMENLRRVTKASDLEVGEVIYKAFDPMDDNWDLPATYAQDEDQLDYYHVGVITSVEPLIITHCTTPSVKQDYKLGSWAYAGNLKKVNYEGVGPVEEVKKAIIDRPTGVTGDTVNMRKGAGLNYDRIEKIQFGTEVDVMADLGEWCYIKVDGKSGYVMSNFILYAGDPDTMDDPVELTEDARADMLAALTKLDEAREMIARIVGRG